MNNLAEVAVEVSRLASLARVKFAPVVGITLLHWRGYALFFRARGGLQSD